MGGKRTPLICAARGCDGCEVCMIEIKNWLRNIKAFKDEDPEMINKIADRIQTLEEALTEAMEWNWMDDDLTADIVDKCCDALKGLYVRQERG